MKLSTVCTLFLQTAAMAELAVDKTSTDFVPSNENRELNLDAVVTKEDSEFDRTLQVRHKLQESSIRQMSHVFSFYAFHVIRVKERAKARVKEKDTTMEGRKRR